MFASSQSIQNAFTYADKALAFAFGRRLQSVGKRQNVGLRTLIFITIEVDESSGTNVIPKNCPSTMTKT